MILNNGKKKADCLKTSGLEKSRDSESPGFSFFSSYIFQIGFQGEWIFWTLHWEFKKHTQKKIRKASSTAKVAKAGSLAET